MQAHSGVVKASHGHQTVQNIGKAFIGILCHDADCVQVTAVENFAAEVQDLTRNKTQGDGRSMFHLYYLLCQQ